MKKNRSAVPHTHFEQVPVLVVRRIAKLFPATNVLAAGVIPPDPVALKTEPYSSISVRPRDRS